MIRNHSHSMYKCVEMKTGDLLDCPLCDFSDHDHIFLLQHVETIHPEGGNPSPFVVREELEELIHPVDAAAEEMEGARDGSPEYIECQCGEFCLLTEFESHLEMHYAESMEFDETSKAPVDVATPDTTINRASNTPIHIVTSGPSRPVPIRSVVDHPHRSSSRKAGSAVRDLVDVLCHSTSPPSKKLSQPARSRVPRRLGVRDSSSMVRNNIC